MLAVGGQSRASFVFLWSNLGSYVVSTVRRLRAATSGEITVVHWDSNPATAHLYEHGSLPGVNFLPRSSISEQAVVEMLDRIRPDVVVVSGWMDKGYLRSIRRVKRAGISACVVAAIDDQWVGSARQRLGKIVFRARLRSLFDYLWVAGAPQFAFGQQFGYSQRSMIGNLLSADTDLFQADRDLPRIDGPRKSSRRFVYFGRFDPVKRLDLLVQAHRSLGPDVREAWPLVLIGDTGRGDALPKLGDECVMVLPYLQPNALKTELAKGGVACLVSDKDQWGVSVHEAGLMGMPQLVTDTCGAASEFVISGFNGVVCRAGDQTSIAQGMSLFASLSDSELDSMRERSVTLASRVSSDLSAASLLSLASPAVPSGAEA